MGLSTSSTAVIDREVLPALINALVDSGFQVIGPKLEDAAIVYQPIESAAELPVGWSDQQDGGYYRLVPSERPALFDYVVGPHSWKRYLFPPSRRLWQAQRRGQQFRISEDSEPPPRYAFFGVRSCDLHAIQVQDRVFDNGTFAEPDYLARRQQNFIVAVNCARPSGTCFCASMNTGPKATDGFDLALTEIIDAERHEFLVEIGSAQGAALLADLPQRAAADSDIAAAAAISENASQAMGRAMPAEVAPLLMRHLEHPRWHEVAQRCLTCGNCTLVCPTCFCFAVEDRTDLDGNRAERWRHWDSCFTVAHSYIHGGSIRRDGPSRYRQWMTHKLSTWHDQFGVSGCTGCGRCITWCPVGIDITEEARAIRDSEGD